LPVGLHSGWIFVNFLIGSVTVAASPPGSSMSLLSAAALSQGLVPLVGILLAGALTHYLTPPADATAPPA
jgi:hypothetical protein